MKRVVIVMVPVILVAGGGTAFYYKQGNRQSSADVIEILGRMRHADESTDYEARAKAELSSGSRQSIADVEIFHRRPNKRLFIFNSQFYSGNDGKTEWVFDKKTNAIACCQSSPTSRFWNRDISLLLKNYTVRMRGHETIAGRQGAVIDIVPVYPRRPRCRIVVDEETGVALSQEQFDSSGRLISRTRLSSIHYSPNVMNVSFTPPVSYSPSRGPQTMKRSEISKQIGFQVGLPKTPPPGFQVDGYALYKCARCEDCGLRAAMIILTDGLDHVTIYESRKPFLGCTEGRDDQKKTPAGQFGVHSITAVKKDSTQITVVGSLPDSDLRRVAESVEIE